MSSIQFQVGDVIEFDVAGERRKGVVRVANKLTILTDMDYERRRIHSKGWERKQIELKGKMKQVMVPLGYQLVTLKGRKLVKRNIRKHNVQKVGE